MGRGPEGHPPDYLSSFFGATTATVGRFSLLAMLVYVANEHPTIYAGAGTLQASVVSFNGVVVNLSRSVRLGCARLCGVHRAPSLWAGLRGAPTPAGPFLYPTHIFYLYITHLQPFYGTISGKCHEG